MHLTTLISLSFIPLSLALPQATTPTLPILRVTNFRAFHADPYYEGAMSNLTFHVSDPRPAPYGAEADCSIPNTYFHLYAISALFDWCGKDWREHGFSYRYGEAGLTVRRQWSDDGETYVQGSSSQAPNWTESVYPTGRLLARDEEWLFPITRTQPASPP